MEEFAENNFPQNFNTKMRNFYQLNANISGITGWMGKLKKPFSMTQFQTYFNEICSEDSLYPSH